MKKLLAVLLALTMVLCFAACGGKTEDPTTTAADTATDAIIPNTNVTAPDDGQPIGDTTTAPADVPAPENPVIRLATTTSVNDSGLLPYLLPAFEAKTGYSVDVASAGTGAAIGYAKAGDADLLLVHSKTQEEAFIEEGYASTERISFMYNYFVIVGPADDPAGVAGAENAEAAFKAIAGAKAPFTSRGDESGTHTKEKNIWTAAGVAFEGEDWYYSVGDGMGTTLTKANELNAYALTDKATFLSMKDSLTNLTILKEEADDMKNTYSLIGVNPDAEAFADKDVTLNTEGAQALIDWLCSDEAGALIEKYGVEQYGEQLFMLIKG